MTEVLFIVTVIFVAYIVYTVSGDIKKEESATKPAAPEKPKPQSKPVVAKKTAAKPAAKPAPKAAKPAAPAKDVDAKKSTTAAAAYTGSFRNPDTGETAGNPSNYRFTKRWIKEALVKEGLLDKIYKNNELDEAASEKVKVALVQFRGLKKYQG